MYCLGSWKLLQINVWMVSRHDSALAAKIAVSGGFTTYAAPLEVSFCCHLHRLAYQAAAKARRA